MANPDLPHEQLAQLLVVSRPSAALLALRLRREKLVPEPTPAAGHSPQYRVPRAAADRLMELVGAESRADAVVLAADEIENRRSKK